MGVALCLPRLLDIGASDCSDNLARSSEGGMKSASGLLAWGDSMWWYLDLVGDAID